MSVRPAAEFQGRWSVFWGTSYEYEHRLFDQYWFPRLGEPPLNATLLIDGVQLAKTWAELAPGEEWRLRRVNRDYLVRGVHAFAGAFHPKTYFFGNQHEGVLLVGSGNLTLGGLEEGHEVFSRFASRDPDGLAVIRQWREWCGRIVRHIDDPAVTNRWADAMVKVPWVAGALEPSTLVTDWEVPLFEQFAHKLGSPVDELLVMAPFYDENASVLARLIRRLEPRRVSVYVGRDMSVSGPDLVRALEPESRQVIVHSFEPNRFVHAKLLAAVTGGSARLLSGSANLSKAAMLGTVSASSGNVEIGTLLDTTREFALAAFTPDGLRLVELPLEQIAQLTFRLDEEGAAPPLTLLSAALRPDGRVVVRYRGSIDCELFLAASKLRQPLKDMVTADPVELSEDDTLVWLAGHGGEVLSNQVPVDDPARLAAWLQTRIATHERPRELDARDITTPVGAMLERLHQECVFDIDETQAASRARVAAQDTEDSDFWDRLMQEELRLDARAQRYVGLRHGALGEDDEVLRLLRTLLDEVPSERRLHPPGQHELDQSEAIGTGQPWSPDRRLQVRLFNLLDRWSRALGDPRLRWIDPLAPVRNYTALVTALAECWQCNYLPRERTILLLQTLFGSFVRTERSTGYLAMLPEQEQADALAAIPPEARSAAAALAYVGLQPNWQHAAADRQQVFVWQPFIVPGLEWAIFRVDSDSASIVRRLSGKTVTVEELSTRLSWAASYIDDPHWCAGLERELDLSNVALRVEKEHVRFDVTLQVEGVKEPLADPRLVTLARRALDYRRGRGVVLRFDGGRLSVHIGDPAYARVGSSNYASVERVSYERLRQMEANGAGWQAILVDEDAQIASA